MSRHEAAARARAHMRAPEPGETPLSQSEIAWGARRKVFDEPIDELPVRQCVRPAGTWEWSRVGHLRAPSVWEALL